VPAAGLLARDVVMLSRYGDDSGLFYVNNGEGLHLWRGVRVQAWTDWGVQ